MLRQRMLQRAYSVLEVKSIDVDGFTISGMASTPTPDRMGDVVHPEGIRFKNPAPLLLFHDTNRPVGSVTFGKPTKDGLPFTAKLVDPATVTSAALKERIIEAWESIKAKLIRGVSIGFRSIADAYNRERGGFDFLETEVLELSLVTIPANSEATIHAIKSIDRPFLAASGATTSGVSDTSRVVKLAARRDTTMKPISEQIASFTETRVLKFTRMNEIMQKAADEGVTLDAAQQQEYDGLKGEVDAVDAHITRLTDLDEANKKAAKTVTGGDPDAAARSRGGNESVIRVKENLPPGIEFTRMVIAKAAAFAEMQKGNFVSPIEIAKQRWPDLNRVHRILEKAAVPAATTSDSVYVGPLVDAQNLANEFIEFLRPETIVGKFGQGGIPSLRRVPFNVRVVGQSSDAEGYWVGQGKPKPLTRAAFEATTLTWAKIATIAVLTEESIRFSSPSAEMLVRDAIVQAIIKRMDIDFVDPDKAASAGVSPASITNGLSALSSAGTSADNVRTDLANLLATFVEADNPITNVVLIMPAGLALAMTMMVNSLGQDEFPNLTVTGGRLRGIPVITSNYLARFTGAGNIVIAVNPQEIFLSDDGQVTVDVSREASLEMSDAPSQNGAAGTGASLVSLWQNNMVGLRAERFVNWARRRTTAVAYMDDVNWGSLGSPAVP